MNVSRNFVLYGAVFLVIGIVFGMYMGGSGDHKFAPLHAHINLLAFTLSVVFALAYRSFPAMGESKLAGYHFWLHVVGTTVVLVMLYLLFSGTITEAGMAPVAPIAELLVLIGVVLFLVNAYQNAH